MSSEKIQERRRLKRILSYYKGYLDALFACEQEFGYDDFLEELIEKHKYAIETILERLRSLPFEEDMNPED